MTSFGNQQLSHSHKNHICVCICTYKRPELLERLLSKLELQNTEGLFDYSIVIVDNDKLKSGKQAVQSYAAQSNLSINYYVQPEQNIALARNSTIENSRGNFIGFIDDDEFPDQNWLLNLYKAINSYRSDGILGPVIPHFEKPPPKWVLKGGFFDRPTHLTGHIMEWRDTRTGNALLKKELFRDGKPWFDPIFGSGGEDRDFFRRKIEDGYVFVWCNEAPVYELIPPERCKKSFMLRRALLRGQGALKHPCIVPLTVIKSIVAVSIYTVALPFLFIMRRHVFMKYLIKDFDHIGKILSLCGITLIKEKYIFK